MQEEDKPWNSKIETHVTFSMENVKPVVLSREQSEMYRTEMYTQTEWMMLWSVFFLIVQQWFFPMLSWR